MFAEIVLPVGDIELTNETIQHALHDALAYNSDNSAVKHIVEGR